MVGKSRHKFVRVSLTWEVPPRGENHDSNTRTTFHFWLVLTQFNRHSKRLTNMTKAIMRTIATTILFILQASTASAAGSYFKSAWLEEHNDIRFKYHTTLNKKDVVNLQWSTDLAQKAKTTAEANVAECKDYPRDDKGYGRNGYIRQGASSGLTPAKVIDIWEKRKALGYPQNSALTQVIWRPTQYVGCYIAINEAKKCQAAICYYAKPGNCNMSGAEGTSVAQVQKWRMRTMADNSNCTPECPPEGCFTAPPTKRPTRKPTKKPVN